MNRLALICCMTLITPLAVYAELPPGSYDTLRAEAPEVLIIEVMQVKTKAEKQNQTEVMVIAKVLYVEHTVSRLRAGSNIEIIYTRSNTSVPGPRPIPVLTDRSIVPADLKKSPSGPAFEPAAHGMSFVMKPERTR